jgi:type III secretion protein C
LKVCLLKPLTQHLGSIAMLSMALICADPGVQSSRAEDAGRASSAWRDQAYPYLAIDQALPDALREFGHNVELAIDVSPGVRGRLRHYQHEGSAGDFLGYLADEHRLDWVLDKGRLYISSADEKVARSWSGGAGVFEDARAALVGAGLDDPRFAVGFDAGRGEINLFAPPRYVALASPVIERVVAPPAARTVNVIHGRPRTGGT